MANYDTNKINVTLVKQYKIIFSQEANKFNNTTYNTFSSSYLNSCSDPYVKSMAINLDGLYKKIQTGYKNIDKWWESYNSDADGLERFLSNESSSGAISKSSVRNFASSKLSNLMDYKNDLTGSFNQNVINVNPVFTYNEAVTDFATFGEVNNLGGAATFGEYISITEEELTEVSNEYLENVGTTYTEKGTKSGWDKFIDWLKGVGETIGDVLQSVGATLVVAVQSLIKGIMQFGEALVDFVLIVSCVVSSVITGLADLVVWISGGDPHFTKDIWANTMGFVKTEYVNGWYTDFYNSSPVGTWLNEYSYIKPGGIVDNVLSGIGYVAGIIVLVYATFGVGSVVATPSVGGASVTITTSTIDSGIIAAAAGTGRSTSDAWNDGAGAVEGLNYGISKGLWEGAQMFGGKTFSSLKLLQGTGIGSSFVNSLSRIILDSADGASAGGIDPLLQMTYAPNEEDMERIMHFVNFDGNGNQISNKTWDELTFDEKYEALFKANGGWRTVSTGAMIGGGASTFSEVFSSVWNPVKSKIEPTEVLEDVVTPSNELFSLDMNGSKINLPDSVVAAVGKNNIESIMNGTIDAATKYNILRNIANGNGDYYVERIGFDWFEKNAYDPFNASIYATRGDYEKANEILCKIIVHNDEAFTSIKKEILDNILKGDNSFLKNSEEINKAIALLKENGNSSLEAIYILSNNNHIDAEKIMMSLDEFKDGYALVIAKDGTFKIVESSSLAYANKSKELISNLNNETNSLGSVTLDDKLNSGVLNIFEDMEQLNKTHQFYTLNSPEISVRVSGFAITDGNVYTTFKNNKALFINPKVKIDYSVDEAVTTTHEYLHRACSKNALKVYKDGKWYTSFNEGITEYLASSLHDVPVIRGHSSYEDNSMFVQMLDEAFAANGYKNLVSDCYLRGDVTKISTAIDYYAGAGTFDYMLQQMQLIEAERNGSKTALSLIKELEDRVIKPILMGGNYK